MFWCVIFYRIPCRSVFFSLRGKRGTGRRGGRRYRRTVTENHDGLLVCVSAGVIAVPSSFSLLVFTRRIIYKAALSQVEVDRRSKINVTPKNIHILFFLVVVLGKHVRALQQDVHLAWSN